MEVLHDERWAYGNSIGYIIEDHDTNYRRIGSNAGLTQEVAKNPLE